nr:hypothetical protein [Spirulina major]
MLGMSKAIVLHGREKLDEAGLGDATDLAVVADGTMRSHWKILSESNRRKDNYFLLTANYESIRRKARSILISE